MYLKNNPRARKLVTHPVTLDVLQVLGEVGERALEDLAVKGRSHSGLNIDVSLVSLLGLRKDKVGGLLDSLHELGNLVLVGGKEVVVGNVKDGAEAAASELGELIDTEHLDVVLGTSVGGEPLLKLDHLDVLKTDTGIDLSVDDGLGDVHSAADGGVVGRGHSVVLGELIDLDLLGC